MQRIRSGQPSETPKEIQDFREMRITIQNPTEFHFELLPEK
jgi:hypothetical protein